MTSAPTSTVPQQRDNLCGPFQAARVLADSGFESWDGEPLDQDLLALRAGTLLPDLPPERSIPAGAQSLLDYRHELPVVPAEHSGTSPEELARAIEAAAGGALRAVPLRTRWTAGRVLRLVSFGLELGARLERGDGHDGGVLCVLPAEAAGKLRGLGFEIDFWDNGTRR